jgi:hypothetical protein
MQNNNLFFIAGGDGTTSLIAVSSFQFQHWRRIAVYELIKTPYKWLKKSPKERSTKKFTSTMVALSDEMQFQKCMVPIKIQCDDCGQRYAFDVEPVNGRMPSAIACPTCGADGTTAANESIARLLPPIAPGSPIRMISPANPGPIQTTPMAPAAPPLPPASPPPIAPIRAAPQVQSAPPAPAIQLSSRPAAPTTAPKVDPRLGMVDRTQAEHEARAKAMWGDSQDQITGYLLLQGFSHAEAVELATQLFKERASAVRANGIRKFFIGFGLVWVPVIAFIIFRIIGFMPLKLMGACILAGVYGAYLALNGILMAVAPKSEKGDVADQ